MIDIKYLLFVLVPIIAFLFAWLVIERIKRENLEEKMARIISGNDRVEAKTYLMTPSEQRFFEEIQKVFKEKYLIFSQVSLAAIINIKENQLDRFERRNIINKFYLDFVICDKKSTKSLLVIELNDKTHILSSRKERDTYIKSLLDSSKIPFYACTVNTESYQGDIEGIKKLLI